MSENSFPNWLWVVVACIFGIHCTADESLAQDWSIKQLKDQEHPIFESAGQQFDFRDDVFEHLVAELNTDFIDDQLHLNILARSPRIGGYRSYRHVHGSNRMTSRVLRRMVEGVSSVELRDQTGRLIPATLTPREQKLPERRLNPDGSINYLAMTQQDFIVQLEIVSASLTQGSYQVDLFLESQLRLQIKFQVDPALHTVAFHSTLYFSPQSSTQEAKPEQQAVPLNKLDKPTDWEERDFEGKYFLLSQAIKRDIKELSRWVDFLFVEKEYRLLEEIILTQPEGFDCYKIGIRLAKASAPNWPRITYWAQTYRRGHTNATPATVIEEHGDAYFSWCSQNQIEIPDNVKYKPKNVDEYWGKLDSKNVFAALKAPASITRFTGKTVEKSKSYLQQFERAVLTTVNWKQTYEERSDELLQLLKHPNDEVRKQVFLAYTRLSPYIVPFKKLLQIANDETQADSVREIATLAASHGPPLKVCDDMNIIAGQPDHPGWKPAVSRLGDMGSGYDLGVLRAQKPDDETLQSILQRSIKLIVDREAAIQKIWRSDKQESSQSQARLLDARKKLTRLAESSLQERADVEPLQRWTNLYFKRLGSRSVVLDALNQVAKNSQNGNFKNHLESRIRNVIDALDQ